MIPIRSVTQSPLPFVLILGSMLLYTIVPGGAIPGDILVLGYLTLIAFSSQSLGIALRDIRPMVPGSYLFLLAGVLALWGDGLTIWGIIGVSRDGVAACWFLVGLIAARRTNLSSSQLADVALLLIGVQTVALLVTFLGYRAGGTFPNPNYAAHFVMTLTMAVVVHTDRKKLLIPAIFGLAVGIYTTGSFGLIIGALVGAVAAFAFGSNASSAVSRLSRTVLLIACVYLSVIWIQSGQVDSSVDFSQSLNTARLDRSGGARVTLWSTAIEAWSSDPAGLGPDGLRAKEILTSHKGVSDSHSDFVTTFAERGFLGILGLAGITVGVVRSAMPNHRSTLIMMSSIVAAGVFRDTLHYRHALLVLGLTLGVALNEARKSATDPVVGSSRGELSTWSK